MVLQSLHAAGLGPDGPAFWFMLASVLAGAVLVLRAHRAEQRAKRLREHLQEARIELAGSRGKLTELIELKEKLEHAEQIRMQLEAENAVTQARLQERETALEEMRIRMDTDFRATASKMLQETQRSFLERADENFSRHREKQGREAEERRRAVDELVKPMREQLLRYETGLAEMRAEQQKSRGELIGRIGELAKSANDVRTEAQNLANALRAGPKVRGRWGEEQLRNVVEMAGMSAHVDFVEQAHLSDGEKRKQPDMVVSLPGKRVIAVDAKVSLTAFLDAVEAQTDEARTYHLEKHAADLRNHVKALAGKEYAAAMRESLDFVVMFVPGENYFAAAVEARPELFQEAFDKKVLIATPTTLVAILKSAAYGWRQERASENAQKVAAMAKELYESLRKMGDHLSGLGKQLNGAVKKYNDLLGGVEQRVLPRARKFAEYELPGIEGVLTQPDVIEEVPRSPRKGRDLLITDETNTEPAETSKKLVPPETEDDQNAA